MKKILMMPIRFLFMVLQSGYLAIGQIWANKTRSALTTLGIVIGVASVTAVIACLNGLKLKVLSEIESFGTNNIYINMTRPRRGPNRHRSWWSLRFQPYHFENILEHCPSVERFTMMGWGGRNTVRHNENSVDRVRTIAVQPDWIKIENRSIILGRPINIIDEQQARNVCIIEPGMRDKLNMKRDCIGEPVIIDGKAFQVIGLIEKKPQGMMMGNDGGNDEFEMYIPFSTNLKMRNAWIWATASAKSTKISPEAQAEIRFFLRRTRNIKPGEPDTFRIQAVESELKKFNKIAFMITAVAGGVVGISLLVGGVGIMNIMLVSVSERTREIGLRKAVGAKNSAIMTQFLVEAVVLCLLGGLIGVGMGHGLTLIITKINPLMDKTQIPAWAIALSFAFAGGVGLFFGLFPAFKAARLDPIEALRHE